MEADEDAPRGWEPWARSALAGGLAIIVALVVWALGSRWSASNEQGIIERQRRADRLRQEGRLDEAIREYQAIAADQPRASGNWEQLGLALLQARRYGEGAKAFGEGIARLKQTHSAEKLVAPFHYNRAFALAHLGDHAAASRELDEAARASPSLAATVDYNALRGVVLAGRGRSDSARDALASAAAVSREDALAFINAWLAERADSPEAPVLRQVAASLRGAIPASPP